MKEEKWTDVIDSKRDIFDLKLDQVWKYRDLLYMFVKRDFVSQYKQTILGPAWYVIQPIITTLMFTVIFGKLANIPTDNIPHVLFYMSGITCWTYFSDCLTKTSTTFRDNQSVFGKVYFPRFIAPLSVVISGLLKLAVQFLMFLMIYVYFYCFTEAPIKPNGYLLLFPLLIILMAFLGLGMGMVITSLTTKYRDLVFLLSFGVQLMMYATPVIYPLSTLSEDKQFWLALNPMTSIIETFKFGFIGSGTFEWSYLTYTGMVSITVLLLGAIIFNKTEKNFMDTV